jgi:hypothetical protein
MIIINFISEENGEAKIIYTLSPSPLLEEWFGQWVDHDLLGKTLTGKTICDEELNDVLGKYVDNGDIVQFYGYRSRKGEIELSLVVPNNYHAQTVYAMRDELIEFFRNRQSELAEEYGQFDAIMVDFWIIDGYFKRVYYMTYKNNEWQFDPYNDF